MRLHSYRLPTRFRISTRIPESQWDSGAMMSRIDDGLSNRIRSQLDLNLLSDF